MTFTVFTLPFFSTFIAKVFPLLSLIALEISSKLVTFLSAIAIILSPAVIFAICAGEFGETYAILVVAGPGTVKVQIKKTTKPSKIFIKGPAILVANFCQTVA